MNVSGLSLNLVRRLVVVIGSLLGWVASGSTAMASCGDYLLHGPLQTTSDHSGPYRFGFGITADGQPIRSGENLLRDPLDWALPGSPSQPAEPPSPCAGGRCQSLPAVPPVQHPSRMTLWKPIAVLENSDRERSQIGRCDWSFPADGRCPPQPWLAVDVPPPELAIL